MVSEKPPPTPPIEGGMVRVKLKKRIPKSYTSRKNQKFISNMVKFTNFCGIFATVFMVATAITIVSCSQDDDDYNSEMYTLAEQMSTRGYGDPGNGGGNSTDTTSSSTPRQYYGGDITDQQKVTICNTIVLLDVKLSWESGTFPMRVLPAEVSVEDTQSSQYFITSMDPQKKTDWCSMFAKIEYSLNVLVRDSINHSSYPFRLSNEVPVNVDDYLMEE